MLVKIAAYPTAIEAHLAAGRLRAERVRTFVAHEHHLWANWTISWALGGAKLYVHERNAARAIDVLAAHDRGDYALPEGEPPSCPRCRSIHVTRRRLSWKGALATLLLTNVPLYFHWATLRCGLCRNEWDLPTTRNYSLLVLGFTVVLSAGAVLGLYVLLGCVTSLNLWSGHGPVCKL